MSAPQTSPAASKPKTAKKKVLSVAEMRSKATFRAMEKMLEQAIGSEEQLWSVTRVMSGEEFLAAAEERFLCSLCGNPLCTNSVDLKSESSGFIIDSNEKKAYAEAEGAGFCGLECAGATKSFARRLGSNGEAMHRFERLYEQLKAKKQKEKEGEASGAEANGPPAAVSEEGQDGGKAVDTPKLKSALKKKPELAAGTSNVPIMSAEVKEREQSGSVAPPTASSAKKAHAVEGYVPKTALKQAKEAKAALKACQNGDDVEEKPRVRFSSEVQVQGEVEPQPMKQAEQLSVVADAACDIAASGYGWKEEESGGDAGQAPAESGSGDKLQKAVFMLDVEDEEGSLEVNGKDLATMVARIRLADPEEAAEVSGAGSGNIADGSSEADTSRAASNGHMVNNGTPEASETAETHINGHANGAGTDAGNVEHIILERIRQGTIKYFPQLAATLPTELLQNLEEESDGEMSSQGTSDDASDWMLSSDEDDEFDHGHMRYQHTFFTELFSHAENWISDDTVALLKSGPEIPPPPNNKNAIPEILTALSRMISVALPVVMEMLAIAVPRNEVEKSLMDLLRTLNLISALPAFKAGQWQVVVTIFLKVLSMGRLPALQDAFEKREGLRRVNLFLGEHGFTQEEYVALLELLLEEDE